MIPQETPETNPRDYLIGKTLRDGEYLVQRVLHQGSINTIYLASHTSLSIPLILKKEIADQPLPENVIAELDYILHGGDITHYAQVPAQSGFPTSGGVHTDHFLREALLLARLQHPAIPTLYDYFSENGYWYLVMDSIPGIPLNTYIQQFAPLLATEALHYTLQLCSVLDYLHNQKPPLIFHALKPEHIMLMPDGNIMLIGFGGARYLQDHLNSPNLPGNVGDDSKTPDHTPIDGRTDLYDLGLILFEMLAGQPLPEHQNHLTISYTSLQSLIPTISKTLGGIIKLAIQPDPQDRYQSAHLLSLALERALQVEERRIHQQQFIDSLSVDKQDSDFTAKVAPAMEEPDLQQENYAGIVPYTLDLGQRKLTREALHRTRQERFEQEQLEQQMASVDESLRRRSSMSTSLHALDAQHRSRYEQLQHPPVQRFHRLTQMSFLVALITFLAMAALLIYEHTTQGTTDLSIPFTQLSTDSTQPASTQASPIPTKNSVGIPESYWQALPSLPGPMADNAAVYVEIQGHPYLYLNGGYRGHDQSPHYDINLYRYDINAATWKKMDHSRLLGMVNNAATIDEQKNIFLTAGYAPMERSIPSLLYKYQPESQRIQIITPPTTMPIGFANAIYADGHAHLYLTEGFMQPGAASSNAGIGWYRYDIATGHWNRLADLPMGLGNTVITGDGQGHILLFGGSTDAGQQQQTNKIYSYDVATNTWSQSSESMTQFVSSASGCTVWSGQFLLVGGYDAQHHQGTTTTTLFDLQTLHSKLLAPLPVGGSQLGTLSCDGRGHAYLTRGTNNAQHPTRDVWEIVVQQGIKLDDNSK